MGQDKSKPRFEGGRIGIEFENQNYDKLSYEAGSVIKGVVHIKQLQPYKVKQLKVILEGQEYTEFDHTSHAENVKTRVQWEEEIAVAKSEVIIANKVDGILPETEMSEPGRYKYPFTLVIPEQAPASVLFTGTNEQLKVCSIRYRLRVVIEPPSHAEMENRYFHGRDYMVTITRSFDASKIRVKPVKSEKKELIGGFFYIGATECEMKATIPKSDYYIGETASVEVECDNSYCAKDIESYYVVLSRYTTVGFTKNRKVIKHTQLSEEPLTRPKYIKANCPAYGKEKLTIDFVIPVKESLGWSRSVSEADKKFRKEFSPSTKFDHFSITYYLDVYVKHKVWNQLYGNKVISTPVTVTQAPVPQQAQLVPNYGYPRFLLSTGIPSKLTAMMAIAQQNQDSVEPNSEEVEPEVKDQVAENID